MKYNYVAIEGNIGAGKTTVSELLSTDLGAKLILEEFEENPFLPLFYKDPDRYAFQVELSFLAQRFEQVQRELLVTDLFFNGFISDYILQKCSIFAKHNIGGESLKLYHTLYKIINGALPQPDLVIYIHRELDVLMSNIAQRGRPYEAHVTAEYLKGIQDGYLNFFKQCQVFPIVVLDAGETDFTQNEHAYCKVKDLLSCKFQKGLQYLSI